MTPETFVREIMRPGLGVLAGLGGPAITTRADRFLLATAMQESGPTLSARYQGSPAEVAAPAKGFWQFEIAGVLGVLTHDASRPLAVQLCQHVYVVPHHAAVYRAIEGNDVLAVGIARLLVLTERAALPATMGEGWQQYLRLWRPGRPREKHWPDNWDRATRTMEAFA